MKFAGICVTTPKAIQLESTSIQDFILTLQSQILSSRYIEKFLSRDISQAYIEILRRLLA